MPSSFRSKGYSLTTKSISKSEFDYLIKLSLEFELAWLNLKSSLYSLRSNEENARIYKGNLIKKFDLETNYFGKKEDSEKKESAKN